LTECQHVIGSSVEAQGGRVVDLAGDSLLAEFATVTSAVQCAIDIQRRLRARNARLAPHRRMEFRVGIDLGHVLVVGGRLYGDCVNVAARVQEMAAPGSICLAPRFLMVSVWRSIANGSWPTKRGATRSRTYVGWPAPAP
jgi:class 3 adenylate cyclase